MVREIWATSIEWVRRVRNMSPSWLTKTCVLYSRRRNAALWMIRSRSRWNALRYAGLSSSCVRPRDVASLTA